MTTKQALHQLDRKAAALRQMRGQLRRRPENFRTFDAVEMAAQSERDEEEIQAYLNAVQDYQQTVAELEKRLA